jgi:hypothetical protein
MTKWTRRDFATATTAGAAGLALPPRARAKDAAADPTPDGSGVIVRRDYVDGPYGQIHVRIAEPRRRRENV